MERTQEKSLNTEERLVVSYSPFFALIVVGPMFLFALYSLGHALLSSPSAEEYWLGLLYGVVGSILGPIAILDIFTIKTLFTPSKIYDKKWYRKTVEKRISDIERMEILDRGKLCFTFVNGERITINVLQRNFSKIPAFISKHTNGRIEVTKT